MFNSIYYGKSSDMVQMFCLVVLIANLVANFLPLLNSGFFVY